MWQAATDRLQHQSLNLIKAGFAFTNGFCCLQGARVGGVGESQLPAAASVQPRLGMAGGAERGRRGEVPRSYGTRGDSGRGTRTRLPQASGQTERHVASWLAAVWAGSSRSSRSCVLPTAMLRPLSHEGFFQRRQWRRGAAKRQKGSAWAWARSTASTREDEPGRGAQPRHRQHLGMPTWEEMSGECSEVGGRPCHAPGAFSRVRHTGTPQMHVS